MDGGGQRLSAFICLNSGSLRYRKILTDSVTCHLPTLSARRVPSIAQGSTSTKVPTTCQARDQRYFGGRYDCAMSDQARGSLPGLPGQEPGPEFDTGHAHSARACNYWLGGKDNHPDDQEAAE